jgi:hypothetical protein
MSNAFMGQRQSASPFGFGGYSGGYSPPQMMEPSYGGFSPFGGFDGGMGGFNPFGAGGYGTTFGGFGMGGGGRFGGGMRAPAYEPTINDAFSRYFSQQYYGGPAFDPFAATSFFGGGYGGGFGFGGGGRPGGGMGGRMRRRRQMFEDLFRPEQPPPYNPPTIPNREPSGGLQFLPQPMPIGGGAYQPGGGGQRIEMGPVTPQPDLMMRPAVMPQPYMGGFSFPFDQALPAKSEAPTAPAAQGFDSIMPVQMQDTPVQSAPAYAPAPYIPPAPSYMEPAPYIPPAPSYMEPIQYTPPAPSYAEPIQYIPPAPSYMEPEQYIPLNIEPRFSPFARSSREMLELDF